MRSHARGGWDTSESEFTPAFTGRGVIGLSYTYMVEELCRVVPGAELDIDLVEVVRAPGRVNLIGEHTDYNDGLVLPAAISLENLIGYLPTDDRRVELTLLATGETAGLDLESIGPREGSWIDFVAATAWSLQRAGIPVGGFRGVLAGDLPIAAGLASSASLELATAWALTGDLAPEIDRLQLARIAQRGENEYVGVQCGLMDQFAVAAGEAGRALMLDCRTNEFTSVMIPGGLRIVVCHTGSDRALATSDYNTRQAECRRALAAIRLVKPGVRSLRDVEEPMLDRLGGRLDEISMARARHVVTENHRVAEAARALLDGDLETLGRLFAASHASLRDGYQVSSPELDLLVELAIKVPGVVAARMTGAGFGGCTVNLVTGDSVEELRAAVMADYPSRSGRTPRVWEVAVVHGAGRLSA